MSNLRTSPRDWSPRSVTYWILVVHGGIWDFPAGGIFTSKEKAIQEAGRMIALEVENEERVWADRWDLKELDKLWKLVKKGDAVALMDQWHKHGPKYDLSKFNIQEVILDQPIDFHQWCEGQE